MNGLVVLMAASLLAPSILAQDRTVPGHYTKSGKWVKDHTVHTNQAGRHKQRVWVGQHVTKGGKIVKAHWASVWVKD